MRYKNESQIWKIVNNINKPKSESEWKLKTEEKTITDEEEIAEDINKYLVNKISTLKEKTDPARKSFCINAGKLWNKVPAEIM